MAKIVDIKVYRGEDIIIEGTLDPVPVGGIGAWTIVLTIRTKQNGAGDVIFTGPATILDADAGVYEVAVPDDPPGTLQVPDIYFYDIWRTNAGAEGVLTIGKFEISADVRK